MLSGLKAKSRLAPIERQANSLLGDEALSEVMPNSVAVWSAGGSSGKSTLALNLAAAPRTAKSSVALIDADTYSPSLDLMLGLQERTAGLLAVARLARQERYSDTEHERLITQVGDARHPLEFVAGLASIARWPELETFGIQAACEQLSHRTNFQVFDLASPLDSSLIEPEYATPRNLVTRFVVGRCSSIVAVTAPDPVSVARLIREFGELRKISKGRILIVVNRFRTSVLGVNARRQLLDVLREHLGDFEVLFVPDEPALLDSAVAKSAAAYWMRPRCNYSRAVKSLASAIEAGAST